MVEALKAYVVYMTLLRNAGWRDENPNADRERERAFFHFLTTMSELSARGLDTWF